MSNSEDPALPPTDAAEPELWRPLARESKGSPKYAHELPKPEGDLWQNILNPLLKQDKERCDGWKDEVRNLLIFAGLFSAIVTAFLIESYQTLQPDPQETVVGILTHIAARLDTFNQTLSPSSLSPLPLANTTFMPSSSSVRVNILWFISLIFSLTVVLVGIVCLQWLREHQAYASVSTPREVFPLFRMRQVALERWRVPMFFTALPLLLEVSLVLFFVGIADFLWGIQRTVAAFVIVGISVPLAFLFLTTILPTLQFFTLYNPQCQINTFVPAPCPYKSPQSRIFLQATSWLDTTLPTLSWLFAALYLCLFKEPLRFIASNTARRDIRPPSFIRRLFAQCIRLACPLFFLFSSDLPSNEDCERLSIFLPEIVLDCVRLESWTKSDQYFLRYRAVFDRTIFLENAGSGFWHDEIPYDVVRGLRTIVLDEGDELVLLSAYSIFQEVSLLQRESDANLAPVHYYFGKLSTRKDEQAVTGPPYEKEESFLRGAGHEWVMCSLFTHSNTHAVVPPWNIPKIQFHATELNIRLVSHLFTFMTELGNNVTYRDILDHYLDGDIALIPLTDSWQAFKDITVQQRILQFQFLFSRIAHLDSSRALVDGFNYSLFRDFGHSAGSIFRYKCTESPEYQSLLVLLGDISNLIIPDDDSTGASVTAENTPSDFFFWASLIFLASLITWQWDGSDEPPPAFLRGQPVFDNWLKYHNHIVTTWDPNWRRDRPALVWSYDSYTAALTRFITGKRETAETLQQSIDEES